MVKKFNQARPLVVLVGPSASGKTALAIKLAKKLDAEIVSADSTLLYRGMDIGTAKPTFDEMEAVPHHLIDVADPDEPWSLGDFITSATRTIAAIHARHKLPIVVGGTGQYVRSLVENWEIPKSPPNTEMRRVLERWGNQVGKEGLHARLRTLDPDAAEKIDFRNSRRTIRALEVIFDTGKRFSEQSKAGESHYDIFILGLTLPRDELYRRVDVRIKSMIERGFAGEVRELIDEGYNPKLPAFSAIGYREMFAYLQGDIDLDTAVQMMKKRTRTFIRHQANWFKSDDRRIHWFDPTMVSVHDIEAEIRRWLFHTKSRDRL
jgi:tRNA dimethylallyltransferase